MAKPFFKKGPKRNKHGVHEIRRGFDRKPGGGILSGIGNVARKLVGATAAGDLRRSKRKGKRNKRRAIRGEKKAIMQDLMGQGQTRGQARRAAKVGAPVMHQAKVDQKRAESKRKRDFKTMKEDNSGTISLPQKPSVAIQQPEGSKTPIGYTPKGASETSKVSKSKERTGVTVHHGDSGVRTVHKDGTETFVARPGAGTPQALADRQNFKNVVRKQKLSGGLGFSSEGRSAENFYDSSKFDNYNPHTANPEYDSNLQTKTGPEGTYINPKMMYKPQEQQDLERAGLQGYYEYKQTAGDKAVSRDEWLAGEGKQYVYGGKTDKYIPFKKGEYNKKRNKTKRKK